MSIERRLEDSLRPVPAPDELWARVEAELGAGHRSGWRRWPPIAIAAALAMVAAGGLVYLKAVERDRSFAAFAMAAHREVCGGGQRLEPVAAVAAQTPLRIAELGSGTLEVRGARRLVFEGGESVAISYEADGAPATLVVAPRAGVDQAGKMRESVEGGLRVREWTHGRQRYAVVTASSAREHAACGLCHRA